MVERKMMDTKKTVFKYVFTRGHERKEHLFTFEDVEDGTAIGCKVNMSADGWELESRRRWFEVVDKNGVPVFEGDTVVGDWHWDEPHVMKYPQDHYDLQEYVLDGEDLEVVSAL